jgi:hypothetical protein
MNSNESNNRRQHLGLNKKSMNLLMAFVEYEILFGIEKIVIQQLHEIRQLARDLNIDNIQLRKMIPESVADIGVTQNNENGTWLLSGKWSNTLASILGHRVNILCFI